MKVLIRADSSVEIGAGHVSRCAALAEELHARGVRPTLLTRDLPGASARTTSSLEVISVSGEGDVDGRSAEIARNWFGSDTTASWLVVDHYGLDATWERAACGSGTSVFVIDDLANRPHACELLLDQNLPGDSVQRYSALVPTRCKLLLGPEYALLRPEFACMRDAARVRPRDGRVHRMLVFFGGTDPADLTTMTIRAIRQLAPSDVLFDVVVGAGNPRAEAIGADVLSMPSVTFHCQTGEMASLMAGADLSIGAGGTATWERCCLGLPALVAVTADNQARVVSDSAASGACVSLGEAVRLNVPAIASALDEALSGRIDLASMSSAAFALTDGAGARRVVEALLSS